jgi:predicted AAA+ superfamily ATPase
MSLIKRNQSDNINRLLASFPVVLVLGVRQCGKSTLTKMVRPDWKYFDLENSRDYDYISGDIDFFLRENDRHIIIDEAQELPELFRNLRGAIDSDRTCNNRFLLTGSSSPALIKQAGESLAGRIGIIELSPLKMNEVMKRPISPFFKIFDGDLGDETLAFLKTLEPGESDRDVLDFFLMGGYPQPVLNPSQDYYLDWMENYFQTYINRDIRKLYPKLDSLKYRRFISILSELSGTIINKAQVGRSLDISEVTVRDYLEIADKTFIWRMIPSYKKTKIKSVTKMPKGIMRDSGLLHYLSQTDTREKLLRSPNYGQNFESFITEELIRGMQASVKGRWDYYYYRTKNGIEVDLLLEGRFGLLPIEIKAGSSTSIKDVKSLTYFLETMNLPLGMVINNDIEIKILSQRIIQIPSCYL